LTSGARSAAAVQGQAQRQPDLPAWAVEHDGQAGRGHAALVAPQFEQATRARFGPQVEAEALVETRHRLEIGHHERFAPLVVGPDRKPRIAGRIDAAIGPHRRAGPEGRACRPHTSGRSDFGSDRLLAAFMPDYLGRSEDAIDK